MNKTVLTLIAFLISGIPPLYARDNLHFSIKENEYAAGIEARWGVSGLGMTEMVYKDSESGDLLSAIDWDIGAQMSAGTGLRIAPVDPFARLGFSLAGNIRWHFPVNGGSMKDTDWDDDGNEYGYGESIASTLAGMEAEERLAAHVPIRRQFLVEAAAELWYSRYVAIAHDGWARWAGDDQRIPLYGAAVSYIQEWIVFAPGIGLGYKLNDAHQLGVRAAVSPWIRGVHIDNHYFRTLESDDPDQQYISYTDKTKGGVFSNIQGEWRWRVTRYVQLAVAVHYRAVRKSRGDTTTSTTGLAGYTFFDKGMAGAAMRSLGCDLTIRTTL